MDHGFMFKIGHELGDWFPNDDDGFLELGQTSLVAKWCHNSATSLFFTLYTQNLAFQGFEGKAFSKDHYIR